MNETLNFTIPQYVNNPRIYTYTTHLFDISDIVVIIAIFVFLAYWYIIVTKDKEKFRQWTNPRGHVINLYKIIRICFWAYVGVVIIFGGIQILLTR